MALAVDALERWYLDEQLATGRLPNLARLRARSARFELETPVAYRSELVWARFLTGREPRGGLGGAPPPRGGEPLDDKDWAVSITFDPVAYGIGLNSATTTPPF